MAELRRRVPAGTRIILTADHGMIDTDASHRIDLSAQPALASGVVAVAGEPRFTHLHVADGDEGLAEQVAERWRTELGERAAWVGTRQQSAALLGPLSERARGVWVMWWWPWPAPGWWWTGACTPRRRWACAGCTTP